MSVITDSNNQPCWKGPQEVICSNCPFKAAAVLRLDQDEGLKIKIEGYSPNYLLAPVSVQASTGMGMIQSREKVSEFRQ